MALLPSNKEVTDTKPQMDSATDAKPSMGLMRDPMSVYLDTRTVAKGQTMGLLLALTYPQAGTFTNATRL